MINERLCVLPFSRPAFDCLKSALVVCLLGCSSAVFSAQVLSIKLTDVSTKSAALMVATDSPISSIEVHVYSDVDGLNEVVSGVEKTVLSNTVAGLHDLGLAKVQLAGLDGQNAYYLQAEVATSDGVLVEPQSGSLLPIVMPVTALAANSDGTLRKQDLVYYAPGQLTQIGGAGIALLEVPQAVYPLTALVDFSSVSSPAAVFDLSNLYDSSGSSLSVEDGAVLTIKEYRGLPCPDVAEQALRVQRRLPVSNYTPAVSQVKDAEHCSPENLVCDTEVNVLDMQVLLNSFSQSVGDCSFNDDADLVNDGVVNVLDLQSLLNRYGDVVSY